MAERARVSELLNSLSSYATHDPLGNYVTYCWSNGGMRIVSTKYVCFPIRSPLLGRAGVGRKFLMLTDQLSFAVANTRQKPDISHHPIAH